MAHPPDPSVIRFSSKDADAIQYAARAWDVDFRPIEPASGDNALVQVVEVTTVLSYARLSARVEQRGASPSGMRTFALLSHDAPDIIWCGEPVDSGMLMSFDAGGDFESSSPAGFEVYTLSIAVDSLEALAAEAGLGSIERLGTSARTFALGRQRADALRAGLEGWIQGVAGDRCAASDPRARESLVRELPGELLRCSLTEMDRSRPPSARIRGRALQRALDYIEANAARAPRVAEVCSASGASERTLRYAFQERFGLTPGEYLKAVRLNGVRRDLRRLRDRIVITDAANRWGFWHMGQFAADYRRLFGELPSDTRASGGPTTA